MTSSCETPLLWKILDKINKGEWNSALTDGKKIFQTILLSLKNYHFISLHSHFLFSPPHISLYLSLFSNFVTKSGRNAVFRNVKPSGFFITLYEKLDFFFVFYFVALLSVYNTDSATFISCIHHAKTCLLHMSSVSYFILLYFIHVVRFLERISH